MSLGGHDRERNSTGTQFVCSSDPGISLLYIDSSGGKSSNPDDIEARKKKSLDRTSADFRAKSDRFRKEMDQRMKERGITPPSGGQGGRR